MTTSVESVTAYLTPPSQYFWQWGDGGEVLSWASGSTIAFRPELEGVLEYMAPQGLPPLGAMLLVLAACRDNWPQCTAELGALNGLNRVITTLDLQGAKLPESLLKQVLEQLEKVHRIEREYRTSARFKPALVSMIFEAAPRRVFAEGAARVLQLLGDGYCPTTEGGEAISQRMRVGATFQLDLRCLHGALARLDVEDIEYRLRTGLDVPLVQEPEAEAVPPVADLGSLLDELEQDSELGGVARIARNVMAFTYLPRKMSEPEDSQSGGVSDVTNRGSLDRLLVSELAHDDLTLALRVALNEALYLRRESPPKAPMTARAILLDSGVRLWGVPRVFAVATAMAFVATAKELAMVDVHRAEGSAVAPVTLSTREGLMAHLEVLEPAPHAGAALPAWLRHLEPYRTVDALIVTHAQSLEDPEFQAALVAFSERRPCFVVSVDAGGAFRMYQYAGRGRKLIRQAMLDLPALMAPRTGKVREGSRGGVGDAGDGGAGEGDGRRKGKKPAIHAADDGLPAGLVARPFPLLIPLRPLVGQRATDSAGKVYAVTPDHRLLVWTNPWCGGEELAVCSEMHRVRLVHAATDAVYVVHGNRANGYFCWFVDPERRFGHNLTLPFTQGETIKRYHIEQGLLYLTTSTSVLLFDARDGTGLGELKLPSKAHTLGHGRLYGKPRNWRTDWLRISYDGHAPSWTAIDLDILAQALRRELANQEIMEVFDRRGYDGPWVITSHGHVFSCAPAIAPDQAPPAIVLYPDTGQDYTRTWIRDVMRISDDGSRLYVRTEKTEGGVRQHLKIDLQDDRPKETPCMGPVFNPQLLELDDPAMRLRIAEWPNMTKHFHGIAVGPTGELLLQSKQDAKRRSPDGIQRAMTMEHSMDTPFLRTRKLNLDDRMTLFTFSNSDDRYFDTPIKELRLPNRTRILLDVNGFLHFQQLDGELPDLVMAVSDHGIAVWTSDALYHGPAHFIGDHESCPAADILALLRRYVEGIHADL